MIYSGVTFVAHKLGMSTARPPSPQAILSAGELALDTAARKLIGPANTSDLPVGAFAVLRALMRSPGVVIEIDELIAQRWCPDLEPESATPAIRMAVSRARTAIAQVGGDPSRLRALSGVGYRLDAEPRIVRAYTCEQIAVLDRLIATHPDRTLVAELDVSQREPSMPPAFSRTDAEPVGQPA